MTTKPPKLTKNVTPYSRRQNTTNKPTSPTPDLSIIISRCPQRMA
jgi:hypothetical protein